MVQPTSPVFHQQISSTIMAYAIITNIVRKSYLNKVMHNKIECIFLHV